MLKRGSKQALLNAKRQNVDSQPEKFVFHKILKTRVLLRLHFDFT